MRYFVKESPMYEGQYTIECDMGDGRWLSFPPAEENYDYQQYLAWLEAGNTPEPWEATNGPV